MTLAALNPFDTHTAGGRAGFDQAVKATPQAALNRDVLDSLNDKDAPKAPADALTTLLDKTLSSRDTRVKGRVFVAAGRAVLAVHERSKGWLGASSDDQRRLGNWLGRMMALLQSDPRGVLHQLPLLDGFGLGLTAFACESLRKDAPSATRALGTLLAQVQGAGVTDKPMDYFEKTTPGFLGGEVYPNAGCLGYVACGLRDALILLDASPTDTHALVKALTAAAHHAWAGHPSSSFAPTRVGSMSNQRSLNEIAYEIVRLAKPINAQGDPYTGPAEPSFGSMYLKVRWGRG